MIPEIGRNPEFLSSDIHETSSTRGTFTRVTRLEGLPESVRQQYKKGMVLKEYNAGGVVNDEKETRLFGPEASSMTLLEKATILRDRQRAIHEFFATELPDLVVKSDFLIGQGPDGRPHMYELQENIPKGFDVLRHEEQIAEWLNSSAPEIRQQAIEQLQRFIDRGDGLPDQQENEVLRDKVIDLIGTNNLLLTQKGELRLVDTNYLFAKSDPRMYDSYAEKIEKLREFVQSISAK